MEKIINYYIKEKNTTEVVAKVLTEKISKYEDIRKEFEYWIENRTYDYLHAVEIEGYTAKKVSEIAPFLDAAGVYNFMITLRENPERAHNYISNGFPQK